MIFISKQHASRPALDLFSRRDLSSIQRLKPGVSLLITCVREGMFITYLMRLCMNCMCVGAHSQHCMFRLFVLSQRVLLHTCWQQLWIFYEILDTDTNLDVYIPPIPRRFNIFSAVHTPPLGPPQSHIKLALSLLLKICNRRRKIQHHLPRMAVLVSCTTT